MDAIENFHILELTFLGWTDTKPMRIKITSKRFNKSVIISNSDGIQNAIDYLTHKGFNIIGKGEFGNDKDILISTTFKAL